MPGPSRPVYFAGTPVSRGCSCWAPASGGVSVTVSIFSYAGEVTLGLMTDAGLVPCPETIIAAFEPKRFTEARSGLAGSQDGDRGQVKVLFSM